MTDNEKERKKEIAKLRKGLTQRQYRFCEEYLVDLNATRAAMRAGYSVRSCYTIGSENMRKPSVRKYIDLRLKDYDISEPEILKLMTSIAKSSANDYIIKRQVEQEKYVDRPLIEKIQELEKDVLRKCMYLERAPLNDKQKESVQDEIDELRDTIIKSEIDLEIEPNATYRVKVRETVEVADLDLYALAQDKENGKIKGISFTQHGPKVELSDPDAMIRELAKIKGMTPNKIDLEGNINVENTNFDMSDDEARKIWESIQKEI